VRHMNFIVDGEPKEVKVPGTIAVSDAEAYVMCGINGLGLIQPARLTIDEQLQSGLMVPVLPQLQSAPMQVSAVYPHSRHLASTVRAFIEWTAKLFEDYALPSRGPKEAGIFSTKGEGGLAIKRAHSLLPAGESEVA
jgi:LysR family transcriptional regulator, regulator for bpeEF and oprC